MGDRMSEEPITLVWVDKWRELKEKHWYNYKSIIEEFDEYADRMETEFQEALKR